MAEPGLAVCSGSRLHIGRGPGSHCCSLPKTMPTQKASAFSLTPGWAIKIVLWIVALCPSVGLVSKIIKVLSASCLLELTHPECNYDTPAWIMGFLFLPKHSTVMSPFVLVVYLALHASFRAMQDSCHTPLSTMFCQPTAGKRSLVTRKADSSANPQHCWSYLPQICFLKHRQLDLLKALDTGVKDKAHQCDLML